VIAQRHCFCASPLVVQNESSTVAATDGAVTVVQVDRQITTSDPVHQVDVVLVKLNPDVIRSVRQSRRHRICRRRLTNSRHRLENVAREIVERTQVFIFRRTVTFGAGRAREFGYSRRTGRAEVSKLSGSIKAKFEHNGGVKLGIDNELKQLTVNNNFNELFLDVSKNLSANFTIHTNFSELDNNTSFSIKEKDEDEDSHGPKFDHDYSGKAGSGTIPIKINSEFGEVNIGHDIKFDVTEKEDKEKKHKEKKKTRTV